MNENTRKMRDGIFALHTRRFGTVAERMVSHIYGLSKAKSKYYDALDSSTKNKVEIKFSRATKTQKPITDNNLIQECTAANNLINRALLSTEVHNCKWDSNIEQIKPEKFDILYYGLFFSDKIEIFKMNSSDVINYKRYCDKQHLGNVGEGQFHFNSGTYNYHKDNHFDRELTYEQFYKTFDTNGRDK